MKYLHKKIVHSVSLVQLPPPVHGAAIMNKRVVSILENIEGVKNKTIRLNYAEGFEEMHCSFWRKVIYAILVFAKLLKEYLLRRPFMTYIAFSPFGFGFYRDFFFVILAKFFSSSPYLHLHGTGLANSFSKNKKTLFRIMLKYSKIILISPSLCDDIKCIAERSSAVVVENCVDDPGEYLKETSSTIRILYLANLDERKGVKKIIDILEKIVEKGYPVNLVIAGSDTVYMTKLELEKFIFEDHPSVFEYVEIVGPVYGEKKRKIFLQSDIFLYPTTHDAAPLVVLEALSYGLPVICSDQGALPDMISHGKNGFISENNSIDQYVKLFISCAKKLSKISSFARQTYLEKYSPWVFEENIKKIFVEGNDGRN